MKDWKEIVKNSERYSDFIILDEPIPFKEFAKDKDYPIVQVHLTQVISIGTTDKNGFHSERYDIVGFAGAFEWKDNHLESLDGDVYNEEMDVLGYNEFTVKENVLLFGGARGLDILVGDDW